MAKRNIAVLASAALVVVNVAFVGCSDDQKGEHFEQDAAGVGTGGQGVSGGSGSGGSGAGGKGGTNTVGSGGTVTGGAANGGAGGSGTGGSSGSASGGSDAGDAQPDVREAGCGTHWIYLQGDCRSGARPICSDYELCSGFVLCGCDGVTRTGCLALLEPWAYEGSCEDGGWEGGLADSGRD